MGSDAFLRKSGAALGQTGARANCQLPAASLRQSLESVPSPWEFFQMVPDLIV